MIWLLPRLLAVVLAMLAGGLMGLLIDRAGASVVGLLLGGAFAISVIVVRDTLHGYRLIAWLRGSQEGAAPRDAGLWGELGYRIERSLRLREHTAATERNRECAAFAGVPVSFEAARNPEATCDVLPVALPGRAARRRRRRRARRTGR